jgi:two-component system nitrate/nitrite response regulator NarL
MSSSVFELRVLIVADDPTIRTGLAHLLGDESDIVVVSYVDSSSDLAMALDVYQPDVLLWDLGWDEGVNLDCVVDLGEVEVPIVALLDDDTDALDAQRAGILGLLNREVDVGRLRAALIAAHQGLAVLDPTLNADLLPPGERVAHLMVEELTPRELEVLTLIAEGHSNRAIGHRLGISQYTVKFHVNAILRKLGAQSRTEAAVRGARLGLITL